MRIGEFDINRADGKILLNDIRLDTGILPRGHKLSKEDILYLKMTGIRKITAGEMGVADLSAETRFPTWRRESPVKTSFTSRRSAICAKSPPIATASSSARKTGC